MTKKNKSINFDFYDLNEKNKKKIKKIIDKLIVIDDYLNKRHNCDVYINNNLMSSDSKIKIKKLNPNTKLFLGNKYFIHNLQFAKFKKIKKNRDKIKNIFAFFGSSDPSNETFKFIKAIENFDKLKFKILVGKLNKNYLKIKSFCKYKKNIKIFYNLTNYSTLKIMQNADFAFGSGGINLTERLFLGIPSVAICTAANQKDGLRALREKKIIHYLGDHKDINIFKIRKCLNKFLKNKNMFSSLLKRTLKYYNKDSKLKILTKELNLIIDKKKIEI